MCRHPNRLGCQARGLSPAARSERRAQHLLLPDLRLSKDEVVHHHDVGLPTIVRAGVSPARIRTRAIRASANTMPRNENPAFPGAAGTKLVKSRCPFSS